MRSFNFKLFLFFYTPSTVHDNNSKHLWILILSNFVDFKIILLFFLASYDSIKYWHELGKFSKIVHNLEWFHIYIVLPFKLMLPWANLTIDTNGVIFLIASSSIHDIDNKICFNSIAILMLRSVALIWYVNGGPNWLRWENVLDKDGYINGLTFYSRISNKTVKNKCIAYIYINNKIRFYK